MNVSVAGTPAVRKPPVQEWWEVGDRTYSFQELAESFSSTEPEVKAVYCYQPTDHSSLADHVANGAIGAMNGTAAGAVGGLVLMAFLDLVDAVTFASGAPAGFGPVWALAALGAAGGAWAGVAAGRLKVANGMAQEGTLICRGGHVADFTPANGEPRTEPTSTAKAVAIGAGMGAAAGAAVVVPIAGMLGPAYYLHGIGAELTEGSGVIGGGLGAALGMGVTASSIALANSSLGALAGLGSVAGGLAVVGAVAGPYVIAGLRRSREHRATVLQDIRQRIADAHQAELEKQQQKWNPPSTAGQLQQGEEEVVINGIRVRRRIPTSPAAQPATP